ncbi:hypothetical protein C7S13_5383 [Burkholderia cepacia]|nr:hypothetical protein [Burkholderia cepacia]
MPIIDTESPVTFCFISPFHFHVNAESTTNFSACESGKTAYSSLCFRILQLFGQRTSMHEKTGRPFVRNE